MLITFFRSISDSQDLTADYIDGLLKALFSRDDVSWNLINSISDDALRSSSKMKFYLISEFLNHLYESEVFKNFKVFFSQKILTYLPHAEISKAQKTEIILNGIGHLNDELVVQSIFQSLSTWKFSQSEAVSIYTNLGSRLSDSERLSVIRQIVSSYDSISDLIKDQISLLLDSEKLTRKNKEALLRAILSDAKLYEKYGMDFVEKLIKDELTEPKREESTFSLMTYLVRDSKLSPQQKQSILNGLALDQNLTQKKVMDLLSSVESHLLTNNMTASELKMAVEKIMELAPKQDRVGDFLRRLIIHTPYAGEMTDSMTRELIKNFKISTSDAQTLIMDYYSFDSPSAPSIIEALVRKNEITADIGKVIAAIPNNLASDERYKGILEYVMDHPNTGESARKTIRYKLTGEIPTLENIPTLNWDLPEEK